MDKEFEVLIIDDNHNGNGIAKIDSKVVFIPGCLKGDIVKIKIVSEDKKFSTGKVISFVKKSNHEKVLCPYYDKCGGCFLLHTSYKNECLKKEEYIKKLFPDVLVKPIISHDRFNYRNKVVFHVFDGKIGFYDKGSKSLVEISNCLLLDEEINSFVSILKNIDLSLIDEIMIRKGDHLLVKFSGKINSKDLLLLTKYDITIYENDKLIYGNEYITSTISDIKFLINDDCFFQVNKSGMISIYDIVKSYISNSSSLLDLYCGTGTIGIYVSSVCDKILGVEINKSSIKIAKKNKKINNISNIDFILGDSSSVCDKYDTIIVDPPRAGLSKKVIKNIIEMNPETLIYVSCNPSTLKRDVSLLDSYVIKEINVVNMFPCTNHIECVSLLERKK